MAKKSCNLKVEEYLDTFKVIIPIKDEQSRQEVFDSFFSFISEKYEEVIDRERNLDNISTLVDILKRFKRLSKCTRIIDFGCGTGLSIELESLCKTQVIGVDSSPEMRQLARQRGMTVWSPEQLAVAPNNSFDLGLASYVLHIFPREEDVKSLMSCIKGGGVVAANFHKGKGQSLFEKCCHAECGDIRRISDVTVPYSHGPYKVCLQ